MPRLTTSAKLFLNACFKAMGLEVTSSAARLAEQKRLADLERSGHWTHASYDGGLQLSREAGERFLQRVCAPFREAYSAFPHEPRASGYYFDNEYYKRIDAETYYSVIRHYRPRQIVEVGSGFSSRVARQAIREGQLDTKLTCIDPNPRVAVGETADEHLQEFVERLPAETLTSRLQAGDILFIDSSHRVVTGGDVVFLFLNVLPRLAPGVLVHVHDIYFPGEYPKEWVVDEAWGWNEQYLVHAFLAFNDAFAIEWAGSYMWLEHPDLLRRHFPSVNETMTNIPASLWLRKSR